MSACSVMATAIRSTTPARSSSQLAPVRRHSGGVVTNTGTVEVQSGVLSFTGSYGGSYIQTAGQTVLNGGNLSMTGSAAIQIIAGLLTGSGAVTANALYNGGTTAPGLSAGVIDVVGNYAQTATGTLEIEIDGLNQGSEYDLLTITGAATLAGHLEVIFPDGGLAPAPGDSYQILIAGSVGGQFDTVNVVNLSPYLSMVVVYNPNDVTLDITGVVAGDCDLDGDADMDDYLDLETCIMGPGTGIVPGCRCFDFDADGDVDLIDFAEFQPLFGGS